MNSPLHFQQAQSVNKDKVQLLEKVLQLSEKRMEQELAEKRQLENIHQSLIEKLQKEANLRLGVSEKIKALENERLRLEREAIEEKEETRNRKKEESINVISAVICGLGITVFIVYILFYVIVGTLLRPNGK